MSETMTTPASGENGSNAAATSKPPVVEGAPDRGVSRGLREARDRHAARAAREPRAGADAPRAGNRSKEVPAPKTKIEPWTPDKIRPILTVPFHSAALYFDCEGFALDEDEAKVLADSGAVVANEYLPVDSKAAALTVFSLALAGVVLTKVGIYVELMKRRKKEAAKNADGNKPAPAAARSPQLSEL